MYFSEVNQEIMSLTILTSSLDGEIKEMPNQQHIVLLPL